MCSTLTAGSSAADTLSVRKADLLDLDAIVELGLAAMPMDPQWDYRLRYRKQYPEDTRKFTRAQYKIFLEDESRDWHVMVAELPSHENPSIRKVAAFAVWQLPPAEQGPLGAEGAQKPLTAGETGPSEQRRDADPRRMRAHGEGLEEARTHYFKRVYGKDRIHLRLLATHPDYQRQGIGGNLTTWGIEKAKKDSIAVTLFASQMGRKLYQKLGFRDQGVVKVQVDGESESICVGVMAYVPTYDEG